MGWPGTVGLLEHFLDHILTLPAFAFSSFLSELPGPHRHKSSAVGKVRLKLYDNQVDLLMIEHMIGDAAFLNHGSPVIVLAV